jgi:SAM-dependent methyltransferase
VLNGALGAFCRHYPAYARLAAGTWRDMQPRLQKYRRGGGSFRVLEVGCGAQYPYVALFHSEGTAAVGIDVLPLVRREISPARYGAILRRGGAAAALRRAAGDALFHLSFYRPLARHAGVRLRHAGAPIVRMDATRCGFADGTFDFVYSSACFEHLPDVGATLAEIDRILKPGAVAEIEVHLFASMTGGHEPGLYDHRPPPSGYPLWGHLRDPNWQAPMFLNRWREPQFRDAFAARFDVLDRVVTSRHGEQYLTSEVEAQLAPRYSRDELTTESVLYVLRKRA